MSKRKRSKPASKSKNIEPVKATPVTIEQNMPVDPPQSFERPTDDAFLSNPLDDVITDDVVDKNMDEVVEELTGFATEIPVASTITIKSVEFPSDEPNALTQVDKIKQNIVRLNTEIESLEPRSVPWNKVLEEIGDLKRSLDKLR